jgi:hypothetical protein
MPLLCQAGKFVGGAASLAGNFVKTGIKVPNTAPAGAQLVIKVAATP